MISSDRRQDIGQLRILTSAVAYSGDSTVTAQIHISNTWWLPTLKEQYLENHVWREQLGPLTIESQSIFDIFPLFKIPANKKIWIFLQTQKKKLLATKSEPHIE
jgi:hypothetical protein